MRAAGSYITCETLVHCADDNNNCDVPLTLILSGWNVMTAGPLISQRISVKHVVGQLSSVATYLVVDYTK